jgi:AAA+ ATPase superfamily predicted ATPase
VRYELRDVFYSFWFRFIFKYSYIIEIENYAKLQEIIQRDYTTFSGLMLERWFHRVAMEGGEFTRIGRWWDRKGENEIDMIALNDIEKKAVIAEIKRQRKKLNPTELAEKTAILGKELTNYSVSHICLSMEDM